MNWSGRSPRVWRPAGLARQSNGQVSAFPDRRTMRYYTTIGLMDRPVSVRDRQAIYGDRHVAQAVAVKRLQAAGLPLAAIQGRLAGLPLAQVEAIALGRGRRAGRYRGIRSGALLGSARGDDRPTDAGHPLSASPGTGLLSCERGNLPLVAMAAGPHAAQTSVSTDLR